MASKSAIARNNKRIELCEKYRFKRAELKQKIYDKSSTPEEREIAIYELAKLPRNSSATRIRTRCSITGRPRGCYRKFGISRIVFRDYASNGLIPGVQKSSW